MGSNEEPGEPMRSHEDTEHTLGSFPTPNHSCLDSHYRLMDPSRHMVLFSSVMFPRSFWNKSLNESPEFSRIF